MTRVIVITTIGRSGSSALAGALHQAGVSFETSEDNMGVSEKFNPKGHFEMRSWWEAGRMLTECVKEGRSDAYRWQAAYSAIIARRNEESPLVWGVKTTWAPWTLPYFLPLLPADHRVIVLRRRRDATIQSWMRHGNLGQGMTSGEAAAAVGEAVAMLERMAATLTCPVRNVSYEQIMQHTWRSMAGTLEFCYQDIADVTMEQIEQAVAWIDPELCHHG